MTARIHTDYLQRECGDTCPENIRGDYRKAVGHIVGHRFQEALEILKSIGEHLPKNSYILCTLGVATCGVGMVKEAIDIFQRAMEAEPPIIESAIYMAKCLNTAGRRDESLRLLREIVASAPDSLLAHQTLGASLVKLGMLKEGFREMEWNWWSDTYLRYAARFTGCKWDGSPLRGRTILVHCYGGLGDAIQFCRFVPGIIERGGIVTVHCPPELKRLFLSIKGAPKIVDDASPPKCDFHVNAFSLPHIFGVDLVTLPVATEYLRASRADRLEWANRLSEFSAKTKIGIVWSGNPRAKTDYNRSAPLASLAPLARLKDAVFFSLQKGSPAIQAKYPPMGMELIDCSDELQDFADTAALVDNLDLVIAPDTSTAHLAGALGKPAFLMLPANAEWRWMLDREDSPWYPSMRLFRQTRPGNWEGVAQRIADEIARSFTTNNARDGRQDNRLLTSEKRSSDGLDHRRLSYARLSAGEQA